MFIPEEKRTTAGKLLARTIEGFLVGYAEQRNQYRFWIPSLGRVVVCREFNARVVTSAPEVISIETAPVESPSMSPATRDPKTTDSSCRSDAWQPTSFAEIQDRYPNLFESTVPEPSSHESAQPPSIIAPALGTFPASVPGSSTRNTQEPPSSGQPVTLPTETSPASSLQESITCKPPTVPAPEIHTRIGREVRPPSRFGEWGEMALFSLGDEDSPSVSQALRSPEAASWRKAMEKEIASLEKYGTWEHVSPPPGGRFVDTMWVLKKKRDECGNLVKFKARLTARGFTQIPGLDYDKTFSAVVRTDTLRLLLAHTIQYQLHTVQYDIESAYLNAPLDEEIYIQPPAMVSVPDAKVLRLRKSIYGLKQAAWCWGETLAAVLKQRGLLPSRADPALYINNQSGEFLGVHVDDLLFVVKAENQFTKWLESHFTVNDLGRPQHLLSIELKWTASTVTLSQVAYIRRITNKYLPSGAKPLASPLSPSERPLKCDELETSADLKEYQSTIGSLLYSAIITRPDILFAVCCLSQFLSDPS